MTHIRQQIRSRVVSDLTGLALTGSNIQDTRLYNLTQIQLPCLEIYTENENSEISTIGPNVTLDRELDLIVIGYGTDKLYWISSSITWTKGWVITGALII